MESPPKRTVRLRSLAPILPLLALSATPAKASTGAEELCKGLEQRTLPDLVIETALAHPAGPGPAAPVPPGMTPPPVPILPAHCEVIGHTEQRVGSDGQHYAIRFHLRLPEAWNGGFFFQGGGGSDGDLGDAVGAMGGAPPALARGYAVLSQDSGHDNKANFDPKRGGTLAFGFDPLARINYGHASLQKSVLAARKVIAARYGQAPKHSYFVGCSKGGQEGLALVQRYPTLFDSVVVTAPGMSLPRAAIGEAWNTKSFSFSAANGHGPLTPLNIAQGFSDADFALARRAMLRACDKLDGLADGMILAVGQCTSARVLPAFNAIRCKGAKTAACLTGEQITALQRVHDGPRNSKGQSIYAGFPWDAGWGAADWRIWQLGTADGRVPSLNMLMGAGALASVFSVPPQALAPGAEGGLAFQMALDLDRAEQGILARGGDFATSGWEDISARSTDLSGFLGHGGRLMVLHGGSDPVFSIADTLDWYRAMLARNGDAARANTRFFAVPGMNHCTGGPATDQYAAFDAMVAWVEQQHAPERIIARASPASPFPGRERPLCAFPKIARYRGHGDPEKAESFVCS